MLPEVPPLVPSSPSSCKCRANSPFDWSKRHCDWSEWSFSDWFVKKRVRVWQHCSDWMGKASFPLVEILFQELLRTVSGDVTV